MSTLPVSLWTWSLALSPIVVVLILMVRYRWGGAKAGPVGWLVTLLVAAAFFGTGPQLIIYSQMKAMLLSLYVLYIIWMALILYHIVAEAGAIAVIGNGIMRLTGDPVMQMLILGWAFSSFVQGVSGYGVPVAVVAPLLIGLGFAPTTAVVATSVGHSWSVTFGSMGASFQALLAATGLPGELLAPWSAILLGVACFACGLATVHAQGGVRAIARAALPILVVGSCMGVVQYLAATHGLWSMAGFVAGLAGLGAAAALARLPFYRGAQTAQAESKGATSQTDSKMSIGWAVTPYVLLILIVVSAELWSPLHALLNRVVIRAHFPAMLTSLGWRQPAETGRTISVFGHAGALLAYTALLSFLLYHQQGYYRPGAGRSIWAKTLRSAVPSSIGILFMVGFAVLMEQCGMTYTLAKGLSQAMGRAFPFFAAIIGTLGAFMTGSNTNSNVVFANLQMSTAELIGLNVPVILAAQTAGGALGSMLAPAKIIVGCSTAGLAGEEGQVMRQTLQYGLLIILGLGLLALIFA